MAEGAAMAAAAEEPAEKAGMRSAWARIAETYDEFWTGRTARYTALGLDRLAPEPGWSGLDVACGPGATAAALAERLPDGSTLGIDFAPAMIERARARFGGRPGLSFAEDDAERLSLPDAAFECVTSSFGLMYCYDARAALGHMARVLRPGGRLMLTVWGRAAKVWWMPIIELVESRAAYYSAVCPMMFFYGLPGVLARMVGEVGLELLHEERTEEPMRFDSADQAVDAAVFGGPLAGLYANRLDEGRRAEVREALMSHLAATGRHEDGAFLAPGEVAVAVARRPG
jgi:ubiquinone/menaquinone biosynthesis C-methylase UbiE